jgi:DNA replication protein DnaC
VLDFDAVPMGSQRHRVHALAASDAWLEKGANLLCLGPPGEGKCHLAALSMALIEKGWRVVFSLARRARPASMEQEPPVGSARSPVPQ